MKKTLQNFKKIIIEKKTMDSLLSILQWDLETQASVKGDELLAKLIGEMSLKSYNITTSEEMINLIDKLKQNFEKLDDITKREVELLEEEIDKIKCIPKEEYKKYSELVVKAQGVWEESRKNNCFKSFAPYLKEIFDYNRKFIEYRGVKKNFYSELLNDYEKGMTTEKLDLFFQELKNEIIPLLKEIKSKSRNFSDKIKFTVPKHEQEKMSEEILEYIGFDYEKGILSESAHPFTLTVNQNDVRLTTRYFEDLPFSSIFSTIHEGGHGIYEQGIDENLIDTILADGISMGVHESQSRFFENIVGRSKEFWTGYLKRSKYHYKEIEKLSMEEFYKAINEVKSSLIRVEADELTYSLHIMIRYEIEKGIFSGEYKVDDLPKIWNKKMEEYLGVVPKTDSDGILQDVHWSCGLIGYFPSYALGNVYSAQILNAMKKDINVQGALERGEILQIKKWLNEKIYKYGKLKSSNQIIIDVTGEELNSKYYIEYLKEKYRKIYN